MPLPDLPSLLLTLTSLITLLLGTRLVVGAALRLPSGRHLSPKVLGIVFIALSCGLPKLAVNLQALSTDNPDIAVSSLLGSSLFNLLAVLGSIALLLPLRVPVAALRRDLPMLLAAIGLSYLLALDGELSSLDGLLLLSLAMLYGVILQRSKAPRSVESIAAETPSLSSWFLLRSLARLAVGGLLIGLGALGLVAGGSKIASSLGLSDRVIGLTVVAVCASLPEWLCALTAAVRKRHGFAIAVVLGSNILSLLILLGISIWLAEGHLSISPNSLSHDWPILLGATLLCLVAFACSLRISRSTGAFMLVGYAGYAAYLLLFSLGRPEAERIEHLALSYALPSFFLLMGINALFRYWQKRRSAAAPP